MVMQVLIYKEKTNEINIKITSGILDMLLAIGKEKSADATLNRIVNFAQQAGNLKPEGEGTGEG